jgi:DNA topoisomerase VI subunit A
LERRDAQQQQQLQSQVFASPATFSASSPSAADATVTPRGPVRRRRARDTDTPPLPLNAAESLTDGLTGSIISARSSQQLARAQIQGGAGGFWQSLLARADPAPFVTTVLVLERLLTRRDGDAVCMTQRDLYYELAPTLPHHDAATVYHTIERLASYAGVPRHGLGVHASGKGYVAGCIRIGECDVSRLGAVGFSIPGAWCELPCPDPITGRFQPAAAGALQSPTSTRRAAIQTDHSNSALDIDCWARAIVVVEKDAVFQRLLAEGLCNPTTARLPLVLVTGRGFADLATRAFVSYLSAAYPQLPVLGLCDYNPAGIRILLNYRRGCRAAASTVAGRALAPAPAEHVDEAAAVNEESMKSDDAPFAVQFASLASASTAPQSLCATTSPAFSNPTQEVPATTRRGGGTGGSKKAASQYGHCTPRLRWLGVHSSDLSGMNRGVSHTSDEGTHYYQQQHHRTAVEGLTPRDVAALPRLVTELETEALRAQRRADAAAAGPSQNSGGRGGRCHQNYRPSHTAPPDPTGTAFGPTTDTTTAAMAAEAAGAAAGDAASLRQWAREATLMLQGRRRCEIEALMSPQALGAAAAADDTLSDWIVRHILQQRYI